VPPVRGVEVGSVVVRSEGVTPEWGRGVVRGVVYSALLLSV